MKTLLTSLITLFVSASAFAAPHPGAATSTLVSPHLGVYRSPLGFQVEAGGSGWKQTETPADNKFIAALYKSPNKVDGGTLTVRVDKLAKDVALDKYIQRWMKEYPKYGFDVLGSKSFTQNKDKGYVLDLINRDNNRQLRQVVFLKKQKAVILTCRDSAGSFKDSLKGCNQIIRTFQWNE